MNAEDFKDLVGLELTDVGDLAVSGGVELNFKQKDKTVGVRIFAKDARVEFFETRTLSGKKAKKKDEPAEEAPSEAAPAERPATTYERRKKTRDPSGDNSELTELPGTG